jgi:Saxitoxin biosynthesis operon protein SxtJ
MQSHRLHEDFSRLDETAIGSERNFGLTIGIALGVLASLSWYRGSGRWLWLFTAAVVFWIAAMAAPVVLRPLNRIWFRFGLLLARIVQPIVLGLMFYAILTPFAVIFRRFARKPLGAAARASDASYWIVRTSERAGDDLKNQF